MNTDYSLEAVGPRLEASKFDPCLFSAFRGSGPALEVMTAHSDDLLECGEKDIFAKMENFSAIRFGPVEIQKADFTHIGMDISQRADGSVETTQKNFDGSALPYCHVAIPLEGFQRTSGW